MKVITKDQFYLEQIEALKKRITQEREGVEEFKQMMNDAFKDLEAERDALQVQVEALKTLVINEEKTTKQLWSELFEVRREIKKRLEVNVDSWAQKERQGGAE
jgi:frataxin-like iron-binding protein CyaY